MLQGSGDRSKSKKRVRFDPSLDEGPTLDSTLRGSARVLAAVYVLFIGKGAIIVDVIFIIMSALFGATVFYKICHDSTTLRRMKFDPAFDDDDGSAPPLDSKMREVAWLVAVLYVLFIGRGAVVIDILSTLSQYRRDLLVPVGH